MAKLLHIVLNGLRADAFESTHVPCIDHLIKNGTFTRHALVASPYLALPSLVSLFTSLLPTEHGISSNSALPLVSPHAVSLFTLLRYRKRTCSMFYSRDHLRILAPAGTLQSSVFINSQGVKNVDMQLAGAVATHLEKEKPDLCFLYLQGIDLAGHRFGFMSEAYLESVKIADYCINHILEYLTTSGLEDDYVVMITSDHGGSGFSHEQEKPEVFLVPFIVQGPGIAKNYTIDRKVSLIDMAPTMAKLLGITPHPDWQGRVIREIFSRHCTDQATQYAECHFQVLKKKVSETAA